MRLILENFKCYSNLDIQLKETGITLLSGSSGNGKTSIVQAIFFAISGTGGPNLVKDGEKKCRVQFQYKHVDIVRTKHPVSLTLLLNGSERYVEQDAQTRIDHVFGSCYELCGYIPQSYYRSFLFLSARDKLDVLKKVCFNNTHIVPEEAVEKIKQRLKQQQAHLNSLYGQLHVVDELMAEYTAPPILPAPCKAPARSETDTRQRLKHCRDQMGLKAQIKRLDQRIQELEGERVQCGEHKNESIDALQQQLRALDSLDSLDAELVQLEHKQFEYSAQDCQESLEHYSRQVELLTTKKDLEQCIAQLSTIESVYLDLVRKRDTIRDAPEAQYTCPSCQTSVYLSNDTLHISKHSELDVLATKKAELDVIEKKLKTVEIRVYELETNRKRVCEIERQQDEFTLDECREYVAFFRRQLQDIQYTETSLKKLREKRERLHQSVTTSCTREQVQQRLQREQERLQQLNKYTYIEEQYTRARTERETLQRQVTRDDVVEEESALERELDKHREYQQYKVVHDKYSRYVATAEKQRALQADVRDVEKTIVQLHALKKIVSKTETTFVENQMNILSQKVNELAGKLFHDPIQVEFKAFKTSKTDEDKIQPTIRVYYKNMYCDVDKLSGGEIARINLCFILSFALFFQTPLLMLDECTANLDAELVEQVIEELNQTSLQKIILIAHQIVEGEFTEVIAI